MSSSHWSLGWSERPTEEANIFNPAFCGELLCRSVGEYYKKAGQPMSVALAFVVLPVALHRGSRHQLPKMASTAFAGWVATHDNVIAELPLLVERLRPVVREAMIFSIRQNRLAVQGGGLVPGSSKLSSTTKATISTDDTDQARSAAMLLGRWFGAQGDAPSVLQGFGVLP
ncbi:MAG: three component ABC system middle component [Mesorhizobium sp.]